MEVSSITARRSGATTILCSGYQSAHSDTSSPLTSSGKMDLAAQENERRAERCKLVIGSCELTGRGEGQEDRRGYLRQRLQGYVG